MKSKKGLGLLISLGPKVPKKEDKEDQEEPVEESSAFEDAANEVYTSIKDEDQEAFVQSLKLAIQALLDESM